MNIPTVPIPILSSSLSLDEPTICLNMIVKNESKIIHRLLESVLPIIDTYCICDTGSTDNTIQCITEFFQSHGIQGKICQEPFRDFGYNRTFSLQACETMTPRPDYALLLDADMILKIENLAEAKKWKRELKADAVYLYQGNDSFFYKNVRVVKIGKGIKYWGVTHEVINTPEGSKYDTVERTKIFINDIGDGGAKSDKFERDIRLLKKGLEELPNNDRYTFYLANSYRDHGDREEAIQYYKKRIEIGGWYEEIWQSYYNIGRCYFWMNKPEEAIAWMLYAYEYFPKRVENLYEIIHWCRNNSKHKMAYSFYKMARDVIDSQDISRIDYLFLHKDMYDYKVDYEFSITGYYWNPDNIDLAELSMRIMSCPTVEDGIMKNILSNYKFYVPILTAMKTNSKEIPSGKPRIEDFHGELPEYDEHFVNSTPTFCRDRESGITTIIVRQVDYTIDEKGAYHNRGNITTINKIAKVNDYMKITANDWKILDYQREMDDVYIGLEDMRILNMSNGQILYTANRGQGHGIMRVEYGEITNGPNMEAKGAVLYCPDSKRNIEKNWVLFESRDEKRPKVVYDWYPMSIYDIGHANMLIQRKNVNTPVFFKHVRGSTHGFYYEKKNEIWFLCHLVNYEDRRYYYHLFVVIDADNYELKRYSRLFQFEKESKVEYALGMEIYSMYEGDIMRIGYSVYDKSTKFMKIGMKWIEESLF